MKRYKHHAELFNPLPLENCLLRIESCLGEQNPNLTNMHLPHFPSCFLWSTFFVLAVPLRVPKEGNLDALHKPYEALSVRGDAVASNDFSVPLYLPPTIGTSGGGDSINQALPEAQSLSTNNQAPSNPSSGSSTSALTDIVNAGNVIKDRLPDEAQVPNTGSSLVADVNEGVPDTGAAGLGLGAVIGGLKLFLDRSEDVNQVFQDDSPKVKVTNIPFVKDPPNQGNGQKEQGATTPEAGAKPETATNNVNTNSDDPCPPENNLAWCDLGVPGSVFEEESTIMVHGVPCTLSLH